MEETEYLAIRLQDQIDWYSHRSAYCQKWYKRFKIANHALVLIMVPLNYLQDLAWWFKYVCIAAGITIALIEFLLSLNKYHEHWIQYRSTAELLKHEKFLYLTHAGAYKDKNTSYVELVERCERIISGENGNWVSLHKSEQNFK